MFRIPALRGSMPVGTALGLLFLVLYGLTLCRHVYWYDSAELVTASVVLGIPHPPGYPLYTLIGHAFTWLPLDPAVAVNVMSAVFGALSVSLVFAIASKLGARRLAAAVAGAMLGAGSLFWAQAVVAEVYTPGLAFALAVWLLILHGVESKRAELLIGAAFLAGLGLGVHLTIATLGLGFGLMVLGYDLPIFRGESDADRVEPERFGQRVQRGLLAGIAVAWGASIFLYLPLRASMKPALNFGDPATPERFLWMISGGNYKNWFIESSSFGDRLLYIVGAFYDQLLGLGLILAALGFVFLLRRRRLDAAAVLLMMAGNLYWFFWYSVHDFEVFFLPTTAILCVLAGLGVEAALVYAGRLESEHRLPRLEPLMQGLFCLLPLGMIIGNYTAADMSDYREAEDFAQAAVDFLPEAAFIVNFTTPPEWKLDAVFGMYVQKVRGERPDVRVITRPAPEVIADLVLRGHPVFAYYPVAMLREHFTMSFEGPLVRLLSPSPELVSRLEEVDRSREGLLAGDG